MCGSTSTTPTCWRSCGSAEAIRWFGPLGAAARLFPQDESKAIAGFTFLCACGVFGEDLRQQRLILGVPRLGI
jgi:hypothetical protein